ncbi:MAG TPA: hypothetical protein VNY34_02905 [Solirubrobacteraceae bacterium]|nr:hypothetical protein [Solirubrobacteraceae bacterium]
MAVEAGRGLEHLIEEEGVRLAEDGRLHADREDLELRLEIELVGDVPIAEEGHHRRARRDERVDQLLHRGADLLFRLGQGRRATPERDLDDAPPGEERRPFARLGLAHELVHDGRLAHAALAREDRAPPCGEDVHDPPEVLFDLEGRRELARAGGRRQVSLGSLLQRTGVIDAGHRLALLACRAAPPAPSARARPALSGWSPKVQRRRARCIL